MNERIKELAEQAWPLGQMMTDDTDQFNTRIEKFAELIVWECAEVAGRDVGHFVLGHFGLKEVE
jgi:hypothetical protein